MEQQLADLVAQVDALEKSAGMVGTVGIEAYYYWTIAFMVLIHAGFLSYEMGASRAKNVLATGIKNILAFAFIVPTFFFFGWWIYLAFPSGPTCRTTRPASSGRPSRCSPPAPRPFSPAPS